MTDRVVILTTESIDGSISQSVKRSLICAVYQVLRGLVVLGLHAW